ncbi:MAG: sensor histidine kinase [Opitutae bacterium]
MREFFRKARSDNLTTQLDALVLRILTRPPASRLVRIMIVVLYVMGLGYIDYLSGPAFYLQVFYLVPILLALAWLGLFPAFLTSVFSILVRVGGDYLTGAGYTRRPTLIWNSLGFLATYMVVAWALDSLLKLRRELEMRVTARTAALATEILAREQLQRELVEISERERRIIGNDLHDGLGQHLTAMAFAAEVLVHQLSPDDRQAHETAHKIVTLAKEGILQSRQLARGLLLTAIEPGRLSQELEELTASVQSQSGVRCHFASQSPHLVHDSTTASHLFRIAEEAMRNSIRHGQPTALNVSLSNLDQSLLLEITDNGSGLPAAPRKKTSIGLRVMEHRAKLIGGDFRVESIPGKGTSIHCRVPLLPRSLPVPVI